MATIVTLFMSFISKDIIKQESEKYLLQMSINKAKEVNEGLSTTEAVVKNIENLVRSTVDLKELDTTDEYIKNYLGTLDTYVKNTVEDNKNFLGTAIIINPELTSEAIQLIYEREKDSDKVSKLNKFSKMDFSESNKEKDMSWYYNPVNKKEAVWSDPHTDNSSDSMRMAYTKPVYIGDTLVAVVAVDLFFDDYKDKINEVNVFNGHAFLINSEGNFIVNKNYTEKENIKNVYSSNVDLLEVNEEAIKVKQNGKKSIVALSKLYNGNIMGVIAEEKNVFKIINRGIIFCVAMTIIVSILVIILAVVIVRKISRPIEFLTNLLREKAENLNFAENDEENTGNIFEGEVAIMNDALVELTTAIRTSLIEIKECSNNTTKQCDNLYSATEVLSDTANGINEVMIELAKAAEEQSNDAQNGAEKLENLTGKIEEIIEVTEANVNYVGSITVDKDLLDAAGILEYEMVQVVDVDNGSRLETYTIPGERGTGIISLNGAAARLVQPGDKVIIMAYAQFTREEALEHKPTVVLADENNKVSEIFHYESHGEIKGN